MTQVVPRLTHRSKSDRDLAFAISGPEDSLGTFPRGHDRRNLLRLGILALLAERPMHGYELMRQLALRSKGTWKPSTGSMYPNLAAMCDEGLIRLHENRGWRRIYTLTPTGRKYATEGGEPTPWLTIMNASDATVTALTAASRKLRATVDGVLRDGTPDERQLATSLIDDVRRTLCGFAADD